MVILTIILVQVLCCLYQSPKYYIEIWHERPFSLHGCGETLEVERGLAEFACPDCATPQALPPELMPPPRRRRALPLPPSAPAGARLPCGSCGAMLDVRPGLARCGCPVCGAELAVDPARLRRYLLRALEVCAHASRSCRPVLHVFSSPRLHLLSRPNKIGNLRLLVCSLRTANFVVVRVKLCYSVENQKRRSSSCVYAAQKLGEEMPKST